MLLTAEITSWHILVVDDEPDNLRLISDLLEFSGAVTARAEDGLQALELVDSFKPNFILLDLGMPHLDGWEVHRRLRARPELADVPIVALTALAMPSDAERVRAAGFDAYIVKPFRIRELLAALKRCVTTFTANSAPAANAEGTAPGITNEAAAPSAKPEVAEQQTS